jgi:hypothetical protein
VSLKTLLVSKIHWSEADAVSLNLKTLSVSKFKKDRSLPLLSALARTCKAESSVLFTQKDTVNFFLFVPVVWLRESFQNYQLQTSKSYQYHTQ